MDTNDSGSPIGPRQYVLCRYCGEEATDISRETAPEWAYHVHHRPSELAKTKERIEKLKGGLNHE